MSTTSFAFASASLSEVGFVRKLNEDASLDRPDLGLWVVADGMGGHDSGDYASRLIVELLGEMPPPNSAGNLLSEIRNRLERANQMLRTKASDRGQDSIIASTVVVLMAYGEHFACLWAGDSRMYRLRDGEFLQVTHDHSHVQELVDVGVLSADEAESHPQANVVTRAVGADDALELDKKHDTTAGRRHVPALQRRADPGGAGSRHRRHPATRGPRHGGPDTGRHRPGARGPGTTSPSSASNACRRWSGRRPSHTGPDRYRENLLTAARSATLRPIADIRSAAMAC